MYSIYLDADVLQGNATGSREIELGTSATNGTHTNSNNSPGELMLSHNSQRTPL